MRSSLSTILNQSAPINSFPGWKNTHLPPKPTIMECQVLNEVHYVWMELYSNVGNVTLEICAVCSICWWYTELHFVLLKYTLTKSVWYKVSVFTSFVEESESWTFYALETAFVLSNLELSVSIWTFWGTTWFRHLGRQKIYNTNIAYNPFNACLWW